VVVLVLSALSEPTQPKEMLPAPPVLPEPRLLLLANPLLLTVQLTVPKKVLDVSLVLEVAIHNAQNVMPVTL